MVASLNSNISASSAIMGYNKAASAASAAASRINSGLRINSAKDDAAGSTILTQFKTLYNSNVVAIRNTNNAVSMMQTAEVGVKSIEDKLGRLRDLAVGASNADQSAASREASVKEVKTLLADINNLAEKTNFNGIKLLDGSLNNVKFQVGAGVNDTKAVSLGSASATKIGSSDAAAITSAQNAGQTGLVAGAFNLNGVLIGPSLAAADTASTTKNEASSIAKAAAVNLKSAITGVTATANATEVSGAAMTGAITTGTLTLNGVGISLTTTADLAATRASVVSAINAKADQTGVTAVDTGSDTGGVKLVAADGRNVAMSLGVTAAGNLTSAATGLGTVNSQVAATAPEVFTGSFTLNSDKAIVITSNKDALSDTGGLKDAGLAVGTFSSQTAYASTTRSAAGATNLQGFVAGDFKINGAVIGASLASADTASYSFTTSGTTMTTQPDSKAISGIAKAAAINALTAQTGVTATVNATQVDGAAMTAGGTTGTVSGTLIINGVETASISTVASDSAASRKAVVDAINAKSGQTGVVATDSNDDTKGISLSAADGRNITIVQKNGGTLSALQTGLNATAIVAATAPPTTAELSASTYTSTLTLTSAKAFTIEAGTTTAGTTGLDLKVGTYGAGRSGGALDMIDLSTAEGASAAFTTIDNAIASLSNTKSAIGAIQTSLSNTATDLAAQNFALKATSDTIEGSEFYEDNAAYALASLRADASGYAFSKAIEMQNKLQGQLR